MSILPAVQKKHKKDKHNKKTHLTINVFTDEIKTSNLNSSCSIHCGALNFGTHGEELEPILLTKSSPMFSKQSNICFISGCVCLFCCVCLYDLSVFLPGGKTTCL